MVFLSSFSTGSRKRMENARRLADLHLLCMRRGKYSIHFQHETPDEVQSKSISLFFRFFFSHSIHRTLVLLGETFSFFFWWDKGERARCWCSSSLTELRLRKCLRAHKKQRKKPVSPRLWSIWVLIVRQNNQIYWRSDVQVCCHFLLQILNKMGNKNGSYDALSDETKELLMQRTGNIHVLCELLIDGNATVM